MAFHTVGHLHSFAPAGRGDVRYALHGFAGIGYFAFGFGASILGIAAHGPLHRIPRTVYIRNFAFSAGILALRDAVLKGQTLARGYDRRREGHAGYLCLAGDLP